MKRQQIRSAILILSFLLMSVTFAYMSPVIMMMGLSQGVIAAGLIFWIANFILAFIFGRAFCGYACPTGAEQMIVDRAVRFNLRPVPHLRNLKYLFAVLWVGGAILLAIGAGSLVVNPLFQMGNGIPPWSLGAYLIFYAIILVVFAIAIVLGRRGMCNYFCPMSVVFMAITKLKDTIRFPSFHLEAQPDNCIHCKKCTTACPMSLNVEEMVQAKKMQNPECILCGSCVDTCPKNVIRFAWLWKK
ncbi:MAG: 4Fe-4S dicluster domain-containing protein [Methanoregula sp.]|jgi:ferredoxin-type protein NapH|nr:4Fe-4S dicluster domain-containing protein [Methanoregula sp.]